MFLILGLIALAIIALFPVGLLPLDLPARRAWRERLARWRLAPLSWRGLRPAPVLGLALALGACASLTPSQTLEQGDTGASLAYAAVATICNDVEAAAPSKTAAAEALKVKAWGLLIQERAVYAQGGSVTALVAQLQALEAQAKGL